MPSQQDQIDAIVDDLLEMDFRKPGPVLRRIAEQVVAAQRTERERIVDCLRAKGYEEAARGIEMGTHWLDGVGAE